MISDNDFIRYYVASLYTKLPALRQQDWVDSAFTDTKDNNYLDLKKKMLV